MGPLAPAASSHLAGLGHGRGGHRPSFAFGTVLKNNGYEVIKVNLNGVFYVAQQAARRMVKDKGGVILNMGSTNGLMGYPWYASYNASKAGVIELTPLHGPGTGAQS